ANGVVLRHDDSAIRTAGGGRRMIAGFCGACQPRRWNIERRFGRMSSVSGAKPMHIDDVDIEESDSSLTLVVRACRTPGEMIRLLLAPLGLHLIPLWSAFLHLAGLPL